MADPTMTADLTIRTERHGIREFTVQAVFDYDPEGGEPGSYQAVIVETTNGMSADWDGDDIRYDTAKAALGAGIDAVIETCEEDDDPRNDPPEPEGE